MNLRRQILDASRQILIEQGYGALSLRRIAAMIGCSATAIYLYFDNRDALVHSLIDEGFDMLYDRVAAAAAASIDDGDPLGRLRRIGWEYIAFGLENPEYYEIMFMLNPREMARFPTEKYRRAARTMEPFADALRDGIATGRLRSVEPRGFANVVWATLHGGTAIVLARRLDVRIDHERFLRDLLDNALLGAMPPSGDAIAEENTSRAADIARR
jgi:AcrR family transcriptional regulator